MSAPGLWHNMSCPPGTTISCDPDYEHDRFRYLLIESTLTRGDVTPPELLALLDGGAWNGTEKEARAELRRRLNAHARSLPFPPVVLTGDPMGSATDYCRDLLTAATVLSKCGRGVYMRDKEPNIGKIGTAPAVMLRLPHGVPDLGKAIRES